MSLDPNRVPTLGCSKAASDSSRGSPWVHLWCSWCHIVGALWNTHSNRNRFHSYLWAVFCPGNYFFISSRRAGTGGPILPLGWSSLFFVHTPLPLSPRSQNYHGVRWSIPPFCNKWSVSYVSLTQVWYSEPNAHTFEPILDKLPFEAHA